MAHPHGYPILAPAVWMVVVIATTFGSQAAIAQSDDSPPAIALDQPAADESSTSLDVTAETSAEATPVQADVPSDTEIATAIEDLSSRVFEDRQAAQALLSSAGGAAIRALEKAAIEGELEAASRSLDILTKLARSEATAAAALMALEAVSKQEGSPVAARAAKVAADLTMTDEERSIAALAAESVRVSHSRDGKVYSVSGITRDAQLAHLKQFPDLVSVYISSGVTDLGLESLSGLKHVRRLTISRCPVTGAGLSRLSGLPSLNHLTLSSMKLTNDDLKVLRNIPSLRSLSLSSSVEGNDLGFLMVVPQVDSLHLSDLQLNEARVENINRVDHLRRLSLSVTDADDERMHGISQLDAPLVSLSVMRSHKITDVGWRHLQSVTLTSLSLMQTPITDEELETLGTFRMLETLKVFGAPITDAGLEHLTGLQALRSLHLQDTQVTAAGLEKLQESLPNLRRPFVRNAGQANGNPRPATRASWNLTKNPITGGMNVILRSRPTAADVETLKKQEDLETVFLDHRESQDEDLKLLADVPMKGLVINAVGVTDRGLQALESHPTLESLGIWSSSITDRSLESIVTVPSLTKLTIEKAPITDGGVRTLIERLGQAGKIKTLAFYKCPGITNGGLERVGELQSLERLFLNNNAGLTSALFEHISHLTNLTRLEVDSITLNDEDLVHLGQLSNLEILGMSCSDSEARLTDRGLAHLSRLSSLQSLTIQDADVTDEGVPQLVKLTELQSLGLARTEITDEGVSMLARALPDLLRFDLTGTRVTDQAMQDVGTLTQLERLWLDGTDVGDEGLRQLDRLSNLKFVYLDGSRVSKAGQVRFRDAHPATKILLE